MDFETKKKYYNLCNPNEALEPDDKRNVDLDAVGKDKGYSVRGINWSDSFYNKILLTDDKRPFFKLLTGLPGSGKTTDLKRLAKRLSNPDEGNFFTVFIDALEFIDLNSSIEVVDIIATVIYSTEKAINIEKGGNAEKTLDEGYCQRLWHFLTTTDVKFKNAEFKIPSAGKLVFEMQTRLPLRKHIRKVVASNFLTFMQEAKDTLITLNAEVVREFGRKSIVIIFDSLEKLKGTSKTWEEVLKSAELVFGGNAPHVRLPIHVLYTLPPALYTHFSGIDFMPVIKVLNKDRSPNEHGLAAARQIISKRIPENILKELFGSNMDVRIDQLILWSGGYTRQIVEMLQQVIEQSDHPVSDRAFKRIMAGIANDCRSMVPGNAFDWLAHVAKEKYLAIEDDDHKEIVDRMLLNHVILSYLNNEAWFDLHPAVYKIPGVQEAINNLEKK
ncbi:MAG: hypothetical protein JJV91_01265 [Desulfosarcina sp.]|nr:hypothetical protein [Desulfobacterales bacterium]